ncbi:MAG TPA: prolipoprotein diacylglyceryl transferase, partial [Gammaproteobacteria bacterium]|nr:prolipoprotein diacylglyceryl transferase [Gammaproteobacteria bacterium]
MHYPVIDPIIVSLGPIALRWYGLMYLLGFAAVYLLGQWRINNRPDLLNS